MCGIAGKINFSDKTDLISIDLLKKMAGVLKHRGPDEFGYYRDKNAGLAHSRLSIIDITSGKQPLSNEDDTLWIVFNGEIFNYIELREELKKYNHKFKTKSDTEVILHAYETWGLKCFEKFNGQWALAIWDSRKRSLILSRDHAGILPLYVKEKNSTVWFASEVKAIFVDPLVEREVNPNGISQIFSFWSTIAPETIFSGIQEIKPGTTKTYTIDGAINEYQHFKLNFIPKIEYQFENRLIPYKEAVKLLEHKLLEATKLRMLRADVPVGSYLSGGLDSSLVAWLGRQTKSGEFRTFSIRFEDSEFDESEYQKLLIKTLDSTHAEIFIKRSDIANVFPEVIYHTERPVLRTAPAPLFLLSKLVNESNFKAVITGEGADEFLLGYDIFRDTKVRYFMANNPQSKFRQLLLERLYPYLSNSLFRAKSASYQFWKKNLSDTHRFDYSHILRWDTTSNLKNFLSTDMLNCLNTDNTIEKSLPEEFFSWDPIARAQYLEIITLFSGYIISSQGDRMLMSHSVEGRFPFLDIDVINFCNSLPVDYKLVGLNEKIILKDIAKGKIPDEIIRRKKQPYRAPDAICFLTGVIPDYVQELLSEESLTKYGIFDAKKTKNLVEKCYNKLNGNGHAISNLDNMGIVGILSTQLLYNTYIKQPPEIKKNIEFSTSIDRF